MPEIRFEAKKHSVAVLDGYCSATGKCRTEFMNELLDAWAMEKMHEATVVLRVAGGIVCWRCGDHKPRQGGAYQPGSNPLRSGGWWCADCIARRAA